MTKQLTIKPVSRSGESLLVTRDGAAVEIAELRLREDRRPGYMLLMGRGGASLLLSDEEAARVAAEYLAFRCGRQVLAPANGRSDEET